MKSLDDFPIVSKIYTKNTCKLCRNEYRRSLPKKPASTAAKLHSARRAANQRYERANGINSAKYILRDCRASDKRKGFYCDLDEEFVSILIEKPCSYCDATEIKMTLDRKCNNIGHTKANVVPACYRCNLFRGNMPYDAWLHIVPVMKHLRMNDFLNGWNEKPKSRLSIVELEIRNNDLNNLENKYSSEIVERANKKIEKIKSNIIKTTTVKTLNNGFAKKISDEDFIKALNTHPSIAKALISLGIAPHGKNYERAKKLLGIPLDQKLKTVALSKQ